MAVGAQSLAGGSVASVAGASAQQLIVNNTDSVNEITAAAAKASPSVVTISVASGNSGGSGSGIILDGEGHILTNTHVVTLGGRASNPTLEVRSSDGQVHEAKVVGTDPLSDLAVIKIEADGLTPASFANFTPSGAPGAGNDINMILDIPVQLTVELGRTRIPIKHILQLAQGSVVELDALAGEPMDVLVNGYLIAQGEVVVVNDKFGIRLTDIVTPSERMRRLSRGM